jgi:hypothetical protein
MRVHSRAVGGKTHRAAPSARRKDEAEARHNTRVRWEGQAGRGVCGASGAFKCLRDAVKHDLCVVKGGG